MYTVIRTTQFKKDWKRCIRQGLPMEEIINVITLLSETGSLPAKYRPHKLTGNHAQPCSWPTIL